MNQYPLNQVDYYDSFPVLFTGISKFQDKPAITIYTKDKQAVTKSYRQLVEDAFSWRRL